MGLDEKTMLGYVRHQDREDLGQEKLAFQEFHYAFGEKCPFAKLNNGMNSLFIIMRKI
jgi:hypothetical protein